MKRYAPAKINIALNIKGVLENGYHDLDMIMAPISLYDEIEIEPSDQGQDEIVFVGMEIPKHNTVQKAVELMRQAAGFSTHYSIRIHKHIPSQAGLGGGSADAACVMHAINEMEMLCLDTEQLIEIGKKVGADVPFCLFSRWARVQGFGEVIQPIQSDWKFSILLVKPKEGVSTPEAFKMWDRSNRVQYDVDLVQRALEKENAELLFTTMANALESPSQELLPVLEQIKDDMYGEGIVQAMMSGSGSTIMGFSVDEEVLEYAKKQLEPYYEFVEIVQVGS